jgi:hypothetical protein
MAQTEEVGEEKERNTQAAEKARLEQDKVPWSAITMSVWITKPNSPHSSYSFCRTRPMI